MKADNNNEDKKMKKKLPDWLVGSLSLLAICAFFMGGFGVIASFDNKGRLIFILAVFLAKPFLTLLDRSLNKRNKAFGFFLIPLFTLWLFAASSFYQIIAPVIDGKKHEPPFFEIINDLPAFYLIIILTVIVIFLLLLHFPIRKKLNSLRNKNTAAFRKLVWEKNTCAYLSSDYTPIKASSLFYKEDINIDGYNLTFFIAEFFNVIELIVFSIIERLWQEPVIILQTFIHTFVTMSIPLSAMILLAFLDHCLFMRNKKKLEREETDLRKFIEEHTEARNILDRFYDLPYDYIEFILPAGERRNVKRELSQKAEEDFIQLNIGGALVGEIYSDSYAGKKPGISIELGVELVALTHYSAGDLLNKKLAQAGFTHTRICESRELKPLSYRIGLNDTFGKEEDLSQLVYAEERAERILQNVKKSVEEFEEENKKQISLNERIKKLREEMKNQNQVLPVIHIVHSLLLKPYEIEVNYHGKELFRGLLVTDQDQKEIEELSKSEFHSLLAEKIIKILRDVGKVN